MHSRQVLILLPLLLTVAAARAGEPPRADDPDARLLDEAGVGSSDAQLVAFLKQQSEVSPPALAALVRQLGHDEYAEREEASRRLVACGPRALPYLLPALKDKDAEIAYRATGCVAALNRQPRRESAAVRLLARRRPAGAVAALLRFLPHAADAETREQVWLALAAVAVRDGKPDPALLPALRDAEPARRAVAACLLGRAGDDTARAAVRRLLDDPDPLVRLRAAQGLLAGRERAALPALVGLLEAKPVALAWQAEELLHWAAGGTAPAAVVGAGGATAEKCRAAWQEWWEKQGSQRKPADFGRSVRPPGLMLLAEGKPGPRVYLRGCDGTTRWQMDKIEFPLDVRLLEGDRVLLATAGPSSSFPVTERDLTGKVVWRAAHAEGGLCQRLPGGNTFLSGNDHATEVTPTGEVAYRIPGFKWKLNNGRLAMLGQWPKGAGLYQVRPEDDKIIGSSRPLPGWSLPWGLLDTLPDGGLLVTQSGTLCALDARYRSVWECKMAATSASQWPDGRTVAISSWDVFGVLTEIDRDGRRVWEEVFLVGRGPAVVRCCLGLVRLGFVDGANANDVDLDDPRVRARALKDKDAQVRLRAVSALRDLGRRASVVLPELFGACEDADDGVRAAAWAAVVDLKPALGFKHKDAEVRLRAVMALRAPGRSADAIADLLRACDDADARVRDAAGAALAELGPRGRKALTAALEDPRAVVRATAAGLLTLTGPPEELTAAVPGLRKALKDTDGRVRLAAAVALAEVAPDEEGILTVLKGAVADEKLAPASRAWAATALARLGPRAESARPVLWRAAGDLLATRGANDDRVAIARAAELLDLIATAGAGNVTARSFALEELRSRGQAASPAVPVVLKCLQERDADVRCAAARCLGRLGPAKVTVPALVEALKQADDDKLRAETALALGDIGPAAKEAVPALVKLLKPPDGADSEAAITRRSSAAWALAQIGDAARAARPVLKRMARDDPSDRVRSQAAYALVRIGER